MSKRRAAIVACGMFFFFVIAVGAVLLLGNAPSTAPTQPGRTAAALTTPSPSEGLVLGNPRLRFALLMSTLVDGELAASAEIDGWVAGRDLRWYALSGTGLPGHLREEALINGRLFARAGGGSWAAAPGDGATDPWPLIDVATAEGAIDFAGGGLPCTSVREALPPDLLAKTFGPDGLPAGTTGAFEAKPTTGGCELAFYAQWEGGTRTEIDWSRVLTVSPDAAIPPSEAVAAAGYPQLSPSDSPASGSSSTPLASAGLETGSPDSSSGNSATLTPYGALHYQVGIDQPTFDVAPVSASYDPSSGELRLDLSLAIGKRDSGFVGLIQKPFNYGLAVKAVVVDGTALLQVPDVNPDGCQMTAQTAGAQTGTCVFNVALPARPHDSIRLYLEMTGALNQPRLGESALWVTLLRD